MTKPLEWNKAADAVRSAERVLIVTHIRPDGDAIGSLLGLANMLKSLGKDVTSVVDEGVPEFLKFLPGADTVQSAITTGDFDLMISTDASDEERTGEAGAYGREHSKTVINLDHHPTNTYFGDIYLVDPKAVSATEIVFNWVNELGVTLDKSIAVPLMTGLVTDTLGFRVSSVTANTLQIAEKLMEAGASLRSITARTLDSMSYSTLQLWKRVLPSAQLEGEVISCVVTLDALQGAGLDDSFDGGLVGMLMQVNEAMISVVFKEQPNDEIRLSMRSKLGYDVSGVARSLGGGGHVQASGATLYGKIEDVKPRVMALLQEAARNGSLQMDD